jgi:hypothetical protein
VGQNKLVRGETRPYPNPLPQGEGTEQRSPWDKLPTAILAQLHDDFSLSLWEGRGEGELALQLNGLGWICPAKIKTVRQVFAVHHPQIAPGMFLTGRE